MQKYEYKIIAMEAIDGWYSSGYIDVGVAEELLNKFGDQGWELVSAEDTNKHQGATKDLLLFLKRPK